MSALVERALVGLIRLYRATFSPILPPACRYMPTCSRYAEEAVRKFGPWSGSWLAFRRLLRCHPWGGAGWDPVPRGTADVPSDPAAVPPSDPEGAEGGG